MNIQSILNDRSFQIAFTSSLVFLVAAFPPLFRIIDRLIAKSFGKRIGKNYYIVLVIHAFIVGLLMFLFTSYILKPVFKILTGNALPQNALPQNALPQNAKPQNAKPQNAKPKKTLENFSVGGKMTCGSK
jgi:hypothetical protein